MPSFTYTARDSSGSAAQGELDAPSRRDALRRLQARGLVPVQVKETSTTAKPVRKKSPSSPARPAPPTPALRSTPAKPSAAKPPTAAERLPFLEGLADLVRSGMSAGEAIRLLALRLQPSRLKELCATLWSRLGEGQRLSEAMAALPRVFDTQTINLIAAGEATGNLADVLERLIAHFTQQRELRHRLDAALAYPVFICLLAVGVILFFLFFLLPRLESLLASLGGDLPLSTRLLVGSADFLMAYGPYGLVLAALSALALWRWRRTPEGRTASDGALLRLPLAREFILRTTVLSFCQTLSVLLENGITTADALRLSERTVKNEALRASLSAATDRVLEGETLSAALGRTALFPRLLLDRVAIAEQTGNLAPGLRDIARSYRADLDRWLATFSRTISAGVLVFAFTFVAFIAFAIISAVFQVSASFRL